MSKRRNIKTVMITIPNEQILKRLISTPALSRLSRTKLKVRQNVESVNHTQFADMLRIYPIIGVSIVEIV